MTKFISKNHPKRNQFDILYRDIQDVLNAAYVYERRSHRSGKKRTIKYLAYVIKQKLNREIPDVVVIESIKEMKRVWKEVSQNYNEVADVDRDYYVSIPSKAFYRYISGGDSNDIRRYVMKVRLDEEFDEIEVQIV